MGEEKLPSLEKALELFEPVIGLEVHVELSTKSKMFSSAPNPAANVDATELPNTFLSPFCLGLPGSLPVINEKAVESSIRLGLALGCEIPETSSFARKNYFYPDLPKNYQISQYDQPIAIDGSISVEMDDGSLVEVEIERAHMEEDAGKLIHVGGDMGRIQGAEHSLIDYNRAGVPLIEIVTRPLQGMEERAGELARAYVSTLREIVRGLGISHARMERGNLRCDANVSLRPRGVSKYGTRTETKNVNSLRSIEMAVLYEIRRQAFVLENGGTVTQETRHWHEDSGKTSPGRPKSDADDYRYFPEPDLLPLVVERKWVSALGKTIPENPVFKNRRLRHDWGLSIQDFKAILNAGLLAQVEESVAAGLTPTAARKWWMGEISRIANDKNLEPQSLISPAEIKAIQEMVDRGELTDKLARQVLVGVIEGGGPPEQIVAAKGLRVVSDDGELLAAIDRALALQPEILSKIRNGKVQAAGAIVGAVMREMGGQADAARVQKLILERVGVGGSAD